MTDGHAVSGISAGKFLRTGKQEMSTCEKRLK